MVDLPPGFRFYPTEEELVLFYLHKKLQGSGQVDRVIPVIDLYGHDPWQLPQRSGALCHGDPEQWFFFTPRQEREARGGRPTRSTSSGYWKGAGSPGYVYSSSNKVIGLKRTMVFYIGKAPTGRKTTWKMNEYRAIEGATSSNGATAKLRCEFSLCRVYRGSGFLRAFDRRPSAGVRIETPAQQADTNVAGTSDQNTFPIVKSSSSSSSSSSGNHNAPQVNADIDWDDLISLVELGNSATETERKNC